MDIHLHNLSDYKLLGNKLGVEVVKPNRTWRVLKVGLLFFFSILVVLTAGTVGLISFQYRKLNSVKIDKSFAQLGISPSVESRVATLTERPINILLFGLDKRPQDKFGNSDAIIIVSINKAVNKIKLSSIMRDTYVKIDSVGMDKVNAAYRIGGPQLAIRTINQNFGLNIKDFVSVDFDGMALAIDALEGIELEVTKDELKWVNAYLDENNRNSKVTPPYLTKPGLQMLNGKQAVAYTRIRYVGTDFDRTERQRTVLRLLLKKLKEAGPSKYPAVVSKMLPYVNTSLPQLELYAIGSSVFANNITKIEERRFPEHTQSKAQVIKGVWYLVPDMAAVKKSIFNYIFEGAGG